MVDPVQNLGNSFYCNIEKVFLCTGADGYVPKYNPSNGEYGCLADSTSLLYQIKILVSLVATLQSKLVLRLINFPYCYIRLSNIINVIAVTLLSCFLLHWVWILSL